MTGLTDCERLQELAKEEKSTVNERLKSVNIYVTAAKVCRQSEIHLFSYSCFFLFFSCVYSYPFFPPQEEELRNQNAVKASDDAIKRNTETLAVLEETLLKSAKPGPAAERQLEGIRARILEVSLRFFVFSRSLFSLSLSLSLSPAFSPHSK